MKKIILLLILLINCSAKAQNEDSIDTLRVSKLDTTLFVKMYSPWRYSPLPDFLRGRMKPFYVKIKPNFNLNTYYIIYNKDNRVSEEGYYKNDIWYRRLLYSYTKSGELFRIYFDKNDTTTEEAFFKEGIPKEIIYTINKINKIKEVLNRKGIPKKIFYFDNGSLKKVEFYSRGKLKKIRSYTFFNKYTTEYIK